MDWLDILIQFVVPFMFDYTGIYFCKGYHSLFRKRHMKWYTVMRCISKRLPVPRYDRVDRPDWRQQWPCYLQGCNCNCCKLYYTFRAISIEAIKTRVAAQLLAIRGQLAADRALAREQVDRARAGGHCSAPRMVTW